MSRALVEQHPVLRPFADHGTRAPTSAAYAWS